MTVLPWWIVIPVALLLIVLSIDEASGLLVFLLVLSSSFFSSSIVKQFKELNESGDGEGFWATAIWSLGKVSLGIPIIIGVFAAAACLLILRERLSRSKKTIIDDHESVNENEGCN